MKLKKSRSLSDYRQEGKFLHIMTVMGSLEISSVYFLSKRKCAPWNAPLKNIFEVLVHINVKVIIIGNGMYTKLSNNPFAKTRVQWRDL